MVKHIVSIITETLDFTSSEDPITRQPILSSVSSEPSDDRSINFNCFITEKPAPSPDGESKYKDGFHILIPELMVSKAYKIFLIQQILKRGIMSKIFRNLNLVGSLRNYVRHEFRMVPSNVYRESQNR